MKIRKLSIGGDYKTAMHYLLGQDVLGGSAFICDIRQYDDGSCTVYIEEQDGSQKQWKDFNPYMPMSIEYNIDF